MYLRRAPVSADPTTPDPSRWPAGWRRWAILALFVGVPLLVPVQFALSRVVGELYPSLKMPGFSGGGFAEGRPQHKPAVRAEFAYADGQRRRAGLLELFDVPEAKLLAVSARLRRVVEGEADPSDDLRRFLADRGERLGHGRPVAVTLYEGDLVYTLTPGGYDVADPTREWLDANPDAGVTDLPTDLRVGGQRVIPLEGAGGD